MSCLGSMKARLLKRKYKARAASGHASGQVILLWLRIRYLWQPGGFETGHEKAQKNFFAIFEICSFCSVFCDIIKPSSRR